ncbi:hypothetical protein GYMLUDRAFT_45535 [Collybiopsis luxurians FD-317 M1]|uniref:Cytochrome P450 n=1 Tax=Collybiopsis luxurians FD-317 M1 TaxID=944289 RepID=A0A0D0CJ17_9AGAR|nr:hypothetical protein GYMLUDRAFT_45535 [Collybiopsis luxurians FD-317 M1]
MWSALQLVLSIVASIFLYHLFKVIRWIFFHPLSYTAKPALRGPPSPSWLLGHLKLTWFNVYRPGETSIFDKWRELYGNTFSVKGPFGKQGIVTMDTKTIQHILKNDHIYVKPPSTQGILRMMLGEAPSVLLSEGAQHRAQRKVMNPAFGPNHIRELTRTFFEKATELRDIWANHVQPSGIGKVDAADWLSKATMDVIGLTGFNYSFNALNDRGQVNELNQTLGAMIRTTFKPSTVWMLVLTALPIRPLLRALSWASGTTAAMQNAAERMQRIGREILAESKAYLAATGEKDGSVGARDLISLLLKSNMSTEIPPEERMSDVDVIAQIPTFVIAGFETTSVSTTWALFELAQNPQIQSKLREELLSVHTSTPRMEQLNELPHLDAFVRETLRLHAPLTATYRAATQDDLLPLTQPIIDGEGKIHNELLIRKGQNISLSLFEVNTDKSLWGPDAYEFKPDRWLSIPDSVNTIPGVWSNLMTFLGGPRGCIGWRFALIEMKALLFTLVRSFELQLDVPKEELVVVSAASMQRPSLRSEPNRARLPLLIRPLQMSEH